MNRSTRLSSVLLCSALALPLTATGIDAHASTPLVTASSPRCGTLTLTMRDNPGLGEVDIEARVDGLTGSVGDKPRTRTWTNLPSGQYTWKLLVSTGGMTGATRVTESGSLTAAPCSPTWPRKPVHGDLNADGRGDLLAITTSGIMYRYHSRGTSLAAGTPIGHGWGSTVWTQRALVSGKPYLLAIRTDGTLWRYPVRPGGLLGSGVKLAKGLQGYQNYVLTPDTTESRGATEVWGIKAGKWTSFGLVTPTVFAWNLQRDVDFLTSSLGITAATSARQVRPYANSAVFARRSDGSLIKCDFTFADPYNGDSDYEINGGGCQPAGRGWNAMSVIASPGSIDGDPYDDIVARRTDGNLYFYRIAQGRLAEGVRIGSHWNAIRLIA